MAKSLEELELIFQEQHPKVEKKQGLKKVLNRQGKEIAKEPEEKPTIVTKVREISQDMLHEEKEDTISFSILDIIFYLVLIAMIAGAVIFSREILESKSLGGRYFYEVTNTSMQSVYSKGSLVLVKRIEPNQLAVGDDIVFDDEADDFIISRITEIKGNDEDTNELAFVTTQVGEESDNSKVALASQIRGKVTGSIPLLGMIFSWIGANLWLVLAIFVLLILLTFCIKVFGNKDNKADKVSQEKLNESK